jgi:hypothetical protein
MCGGLSEILVAVWVSLRISNVTFVLLADPACRRRTEAPAWVPGAAVGAVGQRSRRSALTVLSSSARSTRSVAPARRVGRSLDPNRVATRLCQAITGPGVGDEWRALGIAPADTPC